MEHYMEKILGFLSPIFVYVFIFILNAILPGRWVVGYVTRTNSNEKLKYHLNGQYVLFIVIAMWFLLGYSGIMPWDWLYTYRWYALAGAFCTGIIFSLAIVIPYP